MHIKHPMSTYLASLVAVCAAVSCQPAHSQELGNMPPDNTGGRKSHIIYSAGFGLLSTVAINDGRKWTWLEDTTGCGVYCQRFSLAVLPGLYRETDTYFNKPEPGYKHGLFSINDMKANALGAALGVGAGALVEGAYVKFSRSRQSVTVGINRGF